MQEEKIISKETQTNETQTQQQVAETTSAPASTTTKGTKKTSPKPQKTSGKPVEKSPKPAPKAPAKKEEKEEAGPKVNKTAPKKGTSLKAPAPTKATPHNVFPEVLEIKGIGKMSLKAEEGSTFEDFSKLFEDFETASLEYVVVVHTPKSLFKDYDPSGMIKPKEAFPKDLDIFQVRDLDDLGSAKRVHIKSVYTMFYMNLIEDKEANDFEVMEVLTKFKALEQVRMSNQFAWQLYHIDEPAEEEVEEVEDAVEETEEE